jgi:hypothetical protein
MNITWAKLRAAYRNAFQAGDLRVMLAPYTVR